MMFNNNEYFQRAPDSVNQEIFFEIGQNGLNVTDFELQYVRMKKGSAPFGPSLSVALSELTNFTDAHADNSGKFADSDTDHGSSGLLRVCVPDGAFLPGADAVLFSLRNSVAGINLTQRLDIVHLHEIVGLLEERSGPLSGVISKSGTPGSQLFIAIFTEFIAGTRMFGPEILNAYIYDNRTLGEDVQKQKPQPIIGSYYSDGAGNLSQIQGIAGEMGIDATTDLPGAGWTAPGEGVNPGYTFIIPYTDGFVGPTSGNTLTLGFLPGQFGNGFRGMDGYFNGFKENGPTAENWTEFYRNSGNLTAKIIDMVGQGSFTVAEVQQIRNALGINGTKTTAVGGQLQDINTNVVDILLDVDDIVAKLPSGIISDLQLSDQIDGASLTVGDCLELTAAMMNGRFQKDVPAVGQITFYKRDNVTPLTIVGYSSNERTRISP